MNPKRRFALAVALGIAFFSAPPLFSEVIVFVDGTQMEVQAFEIKGNLFVFTTTEGKVRSVPLSLLDTHATARHKNSGEARAAKTPRPVSPPPKLLTHSVNLGEQKARELLESSGMKSLVLQMSAHVSWDLAEVDRLIPGYRRELESVRSAFEPALESQHIGEVVASALAEAAGDPRLNRALGWFRTPLSHRMTRLTIAAQSHEGRRLLQDYADHLASEMPPAKRMELIQRLDDATGLTELEVEQRSRILRAVLEAVNRSVPAKRRISLDEIDEAVEKARGRLRASTQSSSLVKLLFTYRTASDAEIARYAAYWETEEGRWLNQTLRWSLFAGLAWGLETAAQDTAEQARVSELMLR